MDCQFSRPTAGVFSRPGRVWLSWNILELSDSRGVVPLKQGGTWGEGPERCSARIATKFARVPWGSHHKPCPHQVTVSYLIGCMQVTQSLLDYQGAATVQTHAAPLRTTRGLSQFWFQRRILKIKMIQRSSWSTMAFLWCRVLANI